MVAHLGAIRATVPFTLEVTGGSWRSLSAPWGRSTISRVVLTCFHGYCLFGSSWLRSVPWVCSGRGHWLGPPLSEVTGLGLLQWRFLAQACSLSGDSLVPLPRGPTLEATGSSLFLNRSLSWVCSVWGPWLRPVPTDVLTWAFSLRGP